MWVTSDVYTDICADTCQDDAAKPKQEAAECKQS